MSILFLNLIMIISLVSIVALAAVWMGSPNCNTDQRLTAERSRFSKKVV